MEYSCGEWVTTNDHYRASRRAATAASRSVMSKGLAMMVTRKRVKRTATSSGRVH